MVQQTDVIEDDKPETDELTPRDVFQHLLEDAFHNYKAIRELLVNKLKSSDSITEAGMMRLLNKFGNISENTLDVASKYAPYCHAKLEAIEVKSEVEHRFVIRAPQKVKSVEEWMTITGAKVASIEEGSQ